MAPFRKYAKQEKNQFHVRPRHVRTGRVHHMPLRNHVCDCGDADDQNMDISASPPKVPTKRVLRPRILIKAKHIQINNAKQVIAHGRVMKRIKDKVVSAIKNAPPAIRKRRMPESMKMKRDWVMIDFEKLRKIGEGGFGKVFRAYSNATEEMCALKFVSLRKIKLREDSSVADIYLESFIQKRANHQNVLRCWGDFVYHTNFIFVMDYCPIGDLLFFILEVDKESSTEVINKRAQDFTRQIVCAVAYIHAKLGYIHMDLKPQNIMMVSSSWLKVTDFGCAVKMVNYRHVHEYQDFRGGTAPYFPPEILKGTPFDSTVDVWSIGCIAYELLTKEQPFYPKEDRSIDSEREVKIALKKMKKAFISKSFHFTFDDKMKGNPDAYTFFRHVFVPRSERPLARSLDQLTWLTSN